MLYADASQPSARRAVRRSPASEPLSLDRYELLRPLGKGAMGVVWAATNDKTGREVARLGQFGVTLDLDARRPAALAPELRERAERLVLPT